MTLVTVRKHGSVSVLRLEDPKRRNILSLEMCQALSAAVVAAQTDDEVKALVITGAAPAFCAGADLEDLKAAAAGRTDNVRAVYQSFMDVANCSLPTIAAVNGAAVGAGLNLALACDMRIASEDAQFDTRFLKIGLHPGGGHTWMLLRAVGWAEATKMLLLGRILHAEEAYRCGLVQQIVDAKQLLDAAVELGRASDNLPRDLILATKASLRLAARAGHPETFEHETGEQMHSLQQVPFQELVARLQASLGAGGR
jgi:enoyl-CoA hydratase